MIRQYAPSDLNDTSQVWLSSGRAEYHYLPQFQKLDMLAAVKVFRDVIERENDVWVFDKSDKIVGFIALNGNLVDRLYVAPEYQSMGVGSALLNHAKTIHPEGLTLYTHQQNRRAIQFYERHGFKLSRYGISPPPESVPDVSYVWLPDH